MAYEKPKMKCPFCGQEISVNGMSQHVRFKHPEKTEDFKKNRERYVAEYTITADEPEPEPTPEPEPVEEPVAVEVEPETEDEKFLDGGEPEEEYFRIRQVKSERQTEPAEKPKKRKRFVYNPYGL